MKSIEEKHHVICRHDAKAGICCVCSDCPGHPTNQPEVEKKCDKPCNWYKDDCPIHDTPQPSKVEKKRDRFHFDDCTCSKCSQPSKCERCDQLEELLQKSIAQTNKALNQLAGWDDLREEYKALKRAKEKGL